MATVAEPFPISHIAGRYLLFDVDAISHARRNHNICGVLIGTIPNLSQQNVFLGIPVELMPEEARVLVEQNHAYIVDDAEAHRKGFMEMSREDRLKYLQDMDEQGIELAMSAKKSAAARSEKALKDKGLVRAEVPESNSRAMSETAASPASTSTPDTTSAVANTDEEISLFGPTPSPQAPVARSDKKPEAHYITPTTSYPPLSQPVIDKTLQLPAVPRSFPLFRYMHSQGYFSMPGLRFGCNYTIYPGDTLRYHSHFLGTGMDWDQEFDLLDIVGGGRLGTGVKKAYLIGGEDTGVAGKSKHGQNDSSADIYPVRAFSIEWAGM
ncbi:hypothetical protein BDV95DRAFT_567019 [Massariosphaeria phaeospora]|uniref:tRNA-splicing endonuclease subunit Sen34 n=1 Tax=Massariosphaeria phaeospora TaxID=100035 RepID=A0A7C8II24_9PLEO|nr:hypothetical protein BDV95DRAFT_567019 [Massariosphaeria phaeospora]